MERQVKEGQGTGVRKGAGQIQEACRKKRGSRGLGRRERMKHFGGEGGASSGNVEGEGPGGWGGDERGVGLGTGRRGEVSLERGAEQGRRGERTATGEGGQTGEAEREGAEAETGKGQQRGERFGARGCGGEGRGVMG